MLCMGYRLTIKGKLKPSGCNIKDKHYYEKCSDNRNQIKVFH